MKTTNETTIPGTPWNTKCREMPETNGCDETPSATATEDGYIGNTCEEQDA